MAKLKRINLKGEKEVRMLQAFEYCEDKNKSTEYMIQYIQDVVEVTLDEVLEFLKKQTEDES